VVIPFWDEIERFNEQARPHCAVPVYWAKTKSCEKQCARSHLRPKKAALDRYLIGDRLLFGRDTRFFKRGMAAEVIAMIKTACGYAGPTSAK